MQPPPVPLPQAPPRTTASAQPVPAPVPSVSSMASGAAPVIPQRITSFPTTSASPAASASTSTTTTAAAAAMTAVTMTAAHAQGQGRARSNSDSTTPQMPQSQQARPNHIASAATPSYQTLPHIQHASVVVAASSSSSVTLSPSASAVSSTPTSTTYNTVARGAQFNMQQQQQPWQQQQQQQQQPPQPQLQLPPALPLPPYRRAEAQMLRDAIAAGDLPTCKRIIRTKRLPINFPDPDNGWPLLFYAVKFKQISVVEWLLNAGHEAVDCSKDFEGRSALMIAALHKNEQAFELYIRRYPHTSHWISHSGQSALSMATERGLTRCILLLLDLGRANVNAIDGQGCTALHHAASWGHFDAVRVLISRGVSYNIRNHRGWTAADYAYSVEMLDYLNDCILAVAENRPLRPAPTSQLNLHHHMHHHHSSASHSNTSLAAASSPSVGALGSTGSVATTTSISSNNMNTASNTSASASSINIGGGGGGNTLGSVTGANLRNMLNSVVGASSSASFPTMSSVGAPGSLAVSSAAAAGGPQQVGGSAAGAALLLAATASSSAALGPSAAHSHSGGGPGSSSGGVTGTHGSTGGTATPKMDLRSLF